MDAEPEIERAGLAFKSLVWKHIGFVKSDKSKVICIVIEQETFCFHPWKYYFTTKVQIYLIKQQICTKQVSGYCIVSPVWYRNSIVIHFFWRYPALR